jgi:hypothetical protein
LGEKIPTNKKRRDFCRGFRSFLRKDQNINMNAGIGEREALTD